MTKEKEKFGYFMGLKMRTSSKATPFDEAFSTIVDRRNLAYNFDSLLVLFRTLKREAKDDGERKMKDRAIAVYKCIKAVYDDDALFFKLDKFVEKSAYEYLGISPFLEKEEAYLALEKEVMSAANVLEFLPKPKKNTAK